MAADLQPHHASVDERAILYRVAKLWNQTRRFDRPDGLIIVTTHQLAFLTKITTITTGFLSRLRDPRRSWWFVRERP